MTTLRIQERAVSRLDEIYRYTASEWGTTQAAHYINGLFESFEQIRTNPALSRPTPTELGVTGYFYRYQKHFVYWKNWPTVTSASSPFCVSACTRLSASETTLAVNLDLSG